MNSTKSKDIRKSYGKAARDILKIVQEQRDKKEEGKNNDKYNKSSIC